VAVTHVENYVVVAWRYAQFFGSSPRLLGARATKRLEPFQDFKIIVSSASTIPVTTDGRLSRCIQKAIAPAKGRLRADPGALGRFA
jgi:hypothetical protein